MGGATLFRLSLKQWLLRAYGPIASRTFKQCVTELNTTAMQQDTTEELVRVHIRLKELNDRMDPPFPDVFLRKFLMQALHSGLRDKLDKSFWDAPTFAELTRMLTAKQAEREKMSENQQHLSSSTATTSLVVAATDVCHNCKQAGHKMRDCPKLPQLTCFSCRQLGHVAAECPVTAGTRPLREDPRYREEHSRAPASDYRRGYRSSDYYDRPRSDHHRRDFRRDSSRSDLYDRRGGSREYARSNHRDQRSVLVADSTDTEDHRRRAPRGEIGGDAAALQANTAGGAGPTAAPAPTA